MYGTIFTFYLLDKYYTEWEVGCQVKNSRDTWFVNREAGEVGRGGEWMRGCVDE